MIPYLTTIDAMHRAAYMEALTNSLPGMVVGCGPAIELPCDSILPLHEVDGRAEKFAEVYKTTPEVMPAIHVTLTLTRQYVCRDGHHRLAASKLAGLPTIRCIVFRHYPPGSGVSLSNEPPRIHANSDSALSATQITKAATGPQKRRGALGPEITSHGGKNYCDKYERTVGQELRKR